MFDPNEKGNIAIYEALAKDNVRILSLLLTKLDINNIKRNKNGDSVLELAGKLGAIQSLKYLLQKKVLEEMQRDIPKNTFWFSRPAYMEWIDKELKTLKFDDHQEVDKTLDKIQKQLNNKPSKNNDRVSIYNRKFKEEFASINMHLSSMNLALTSLVANIDYTHPSAHTLPSDYFSLPSFGFDMNAPYYYATYTNAYPQSIYFAPIDFTAIDHQSQIAYSSGEMTLQPISEGTQMNTPVYIYRDEQYNSDESQLSLLGPSVKLKPIYTPNQTLTLFTENLTAQSHNTQSQHHVKPGGDIDYVRLV